jgi:hypothetical protein
LSIAKRLTRCVTVVGSALANALSFAAPAANGVEDDDDDDDDGGNGAGPRGTHRSGSGSQDEDAEGGVAVVDDLLLLAIDGSSCTGGDCNCRPPPPWRKGEEKDEELRPTPSAAMPPSPGSLIVSSFWPCVCALERADGGSKIGGGGG